MKNIEDMGVAYASGIIIKSLRLSYIFLIVVIHLVLLLLISAAGSRCVSDNFKMAVIFDTRTTTITLTFYTNTLTRESAVTR